MRAIGQVNRSNIVTRLQERIGELEAEPGHRWEDRQAPYALTAEGKPAVKVGVANCTPDFDLWEGLRNPAMLGLHPVGLPEIWDYYASKRRDSTDESGRRTIFRLPAPYSDALSRYRRAVIISVQMPFSPDIIKGYGEVIRRAGVAPDVIYARAGRELNQLVDRAVTRLAYDLIDGQRAVVPMNSENAQKVTEQAVPVTRRGTAHGPSKGGNYPQKSIAVLTGLGQFGLSRLVIRDEVADGEVQRFIGPLRSLVLFDGEPPVVDGSGGVLNLTRRWRRTAMKLADFSNTDPQIDQYRFCSGVSEEPCSACITHCPSGALSNSAVEQDGQYPDRVQSQKHRFWDGQLQFDYATCCDERGQMAELYDEWVCGRCLCMCGYAGRRRSFAADNFDRLLFEDVSIVD